MNLLSKGAWEIAAGVASVAAVGGAIAWWLLRKKPSEEELERMRRRLLVQSGRLVDGMFLEISEMAAADGRNLTLFLFSYRIGGVDYECSQDVTELRSLLDTEHVRVGFPCTVRYQPGNPQNSIVVAEGWSGLRVSLPQLPSLEDSEPVDMRRLRRN
jgi:hypothetical protein